MTKKKTSPENATEEQVVASQAPSAEKSAPALELTDLTVAIQLIEVAIQRGAYQPRELSTVGTTHARIQAFLEHQVSLQEAARQQQGEE